MTRVRALVYQHVNEVRLRRRVCLFVLCLMKNDQVVCGGETHTHSLEPAREQKEEEKAVKHGTEQVSEVRGTGSCFFLLRSPVVVVKKAN